MVELPTGTVTMLFSDIEGSTLLLSRLGGAYVDALDGQRRVLRAAWAAHEGTEMGTEGDSFFTVFPTAQAAVAAAAQAQRDLAAYPWPAGERVRVRMGIHTGSPQVHDGGYVGLDVHRAARIAAAAHGSQVVMSEATATLVGGSLPPGVSMRDLGSHQLKDITQAQHVFQLVFDGLQADFPPLKTVGASSSLPRPATPLVGRDGELAQLAALLRSPEVRLVTLTGPGGSGKTRLAIEVARRLVERFPDGVYFVPLAPVSTGEVMWTSIAEVLDAPPQGRIPPGFFDHVAHRSALFVLDNLEQIHGADAVVAELLDHAPQAVVVATSRRSMMVVAEHVFPVPPLELPAEHTLEQVRASAAVQLFVAQARKVRPAFSLSVENAGDVGAVCDRLDGLPLAIELAAARTRLLSPKAVLARLDQALDLKAAGVDRPDRQQTLRETIAWSYDLLDPPHQTFFRKLGVFAAGADLDAIARVTLQGAEPLDLISDLVDASLITVTEDAEGEPRLVLLQTVRAFALDALGKAGEEEDVRRLHAENYLALASELRSQAFGGSSNQLLAARRRLELDLDNFREALGWALPGDGAPPGAVSPDRYFGLALCAELGRLWVDRGYLTEARRWLEAAIALGGDRDSKELSRCLWLVGMVLARQGDHTAALARTQDAAVVARRLDDDDELAHALGPLAMCEEYAGHFDTARATYEEALALTRRIGDHDTHARILGDLGILEFLQGRHERALELFSAAATMFTELGDDFSTLRNQHNTACVFLAMGRPQDAYIQLVRVLPEILRTGGPDEHILVAEDYAAILAALGDFTTVAKLLGAAEATRQRLGSPRDPTQESETEELFAAAREALSDDVWNAEYAAGQAVSVEDALHDAYTTSSPEAFKP